MSKSMTKTKAKASAKLPYKKQPTHHGYLLTINYFTEEDFEDMITCIDMSRPDYNVYGFEGCTETSQYHPHIHFYLHYKNARSQSSVMGYFRRKPHVDIANDPAGSTMYCKGYKMNKDIGKYELKDYSEGENFWWQQGIPPKNGVNTQGEKITTMIAGGATLDQVRTAFPAYYMRHKESIVSYMDEVTPTPYKTSFYIHQQVGYLRQEIQEAIGDELLSKSVLIYGESELSYYSTKEFEIAFFIVNGYDERYEAWSGGSPILFKDGWRIKEFRCKNFVFVAKDYLYNTYRKLGLSTLEDYGKEVGLETLNISCETDDIEIIEDHYGLEVRKKQPQSHKEIVKLEFDNSAINILEESHKASKELFEFDKMRRILDKSNKADKKANKK